MIQDFRRAKCRERQTAAGSGGAATGKFCA